MPRSTSRDSNAIQSFGLYTVECRDQDGNLRWAEEVQNALYDEGEFALLDIALRGGTAPASWHIGLFASTLTAAPVETSTLAALKSPTNYELDNTAEPGYSARQTVNRDATANGWPTLALDGGDFRATAKTVSWTASANWTKTVRWIFLTTVGTVSDTTGKLISVAQLSADRTLLNGDTLNVTYSLKLQ